MAGVKLKSVDRFIDRHGKPRHYFRQGRGARVRLPGEPGTLEYLQAYERAAAAAATVSQREAAEASLSSSLSHGLCHG